MLERFKRSRDEEAPARTSGTVATAERPDTERSGAPVASDGGIRRDSEGDSSRAATTEDRTAVHDTTDDDRLGHDDRATTTDDDRLGHDDRSTTTDDDRPGHDDRSTTTGENRFTRDDDRAATAAGAGAGGVTRDRDDTATRRAERTRAGSATATGGPATASALSAARARQRDEFGGINWGASFFGWLVAVGVAAILTALLAAAGAAIGLVDTTEAEATSNAEQIGVGGGIALVVVLMIAYYAGGYVAGRMSRFDGARQGMGTWAIGLVVTLLLAAAAVVLGDQYNVLEQLNLPTLPVGDQTLATGAIVAIIAILLGSLLAALLGGKVGERYHKRVDRAGFVD